MFISPATRSIVHSSAALDRAQLHKPIYRERNSQYPGHLQAMVNVSNISARAAQVAASRYGRVLPANVMGDVFGSNGRIGALGWSNPHLQQPVYLPVDDYRNTASAASRMIASLKTIDRFGLDSVERAGGLQNVEGGLEVFTKQLAGEAARRARAAADAIATFDEAAMRRDTRFGYTQAMQGAGLIYAAMDTAVLTHVYGGPAFVALWGAANDYLDARNSLWGRNGQGKFEAAQPGIVADLRRAAELLSQPTGPSTWKTQLSARDITPLSIRR